MKSTAPPFPVSPSFPQGSNLRSDSRRLRVAFLVFAALLALSGLWVLVPELLRPKTIPFPSDRASAETLAGYRSRAILAAELGAIRGDLWAEAAFTDSRFMWTDRYANLDPANREKVESARGHAETALRFAPINGAAWLFLAKLPSPTIDENRIGTLLEMSYFTAPSNTMLAPARLERVATSSALADKDVQAFIKSDIRAILNQRPEYRQGLIAAYRNAWPQNQALFESLVAGVDPAAAQQLHSDPPK